MAKRARVVRSSWGAAEVTVFVQPTEEDSEGRLCGSPQLPHRGEWRGRCSFLFYGVCNRSWGNGTELSHRRVRLGTGKKLFTTEPECNWALEQTPQENSHSMKLARVQEDLRHRVWILGLQLNNLCGFLPTQDMLLFIFCPFSPVTIMVLPLEFVHTIACTSGVHWAECG